MKNDFSKTLVTLRVSAALLISLGPVLAQEPTADTIHPVAANATVAPAPQVGYGVSQILQLQQANVGDETIIAYIKSSGNSYALDAEKIIYLRQQGVSTAVLSTMLTQPAVGTVAPSNPPLTTGSDAVVATPDQTFASVDYQPARASIVGPSITAIDPSAAASQSYSYYYYPPAYYAYSAPYCYPTYYGYRPPVTVAIGWRNSYHSGGFHTGFHGRHH